MNDPKQIQDITMAFACLTAAIANQLDAPSLLDDLQQIYETTASTEPVGDTYREMMESALAILNAIHGDDPEASH